ncbi:MAG TPA: efflux RND transporter periplasmic adaptor subunit [Labilithrix sp.]|nr:efflux RND transporter periplasmic adaptor subunit [Labilithrix sp.]
MTLRRRSPALLLAMALAGAQLAGASYGCKPKAPEPQKEPKEDGVDVKLAPKALAAAHLTTAQPRSIPRLASVTAAGKVDFVPSRVARIGPPIAGRVGTIPVVVGQKVGRGAVLVTLESVEVGRARADYLAAKTRLEQTKAETERENRLLAGGATSDRAVLVAQTEQAQAQAQLRASEDRLSTLGLGVSASGQSVSLVSPIAGTVLQVNARMGQPVGPEATLVVVGETEQVWLEIDVYERDVGKVHVGDDVRVTSIAFPGRVFEGKVDQIGSTVDPERHVLEARIVLPNQDGALKPGMTASARVMGAAVGDGGTALVVSRHAIQTVDGQPFVFVQREPGKYEMRPVERGAELDDDIEILRGLKADETVVVDGSFILKSEALKAQMGAND